VRPSTFTSYRLHVTRYVIPAIGNVRLHQLRASHLNGLYARMLSGDANDGRPLSARTVRYCHTIVRRALADGMREGTLTTNVADAARAPRPPRPPMTTWTSSELRTFLDATADQEHGVLYLVLATTGMRRGEACGLRWRDVDWDGAAVRIERSLNTLGHVVSEGPTKTGRSRRVPLAPGTADALRTHRSNVLDPNGRVFDVHPDTVTKAFRAHVIRLGLPAMKLHGLRHTWATLALAAGIHPKVVQEVLGHASITMTLDTYSAVLPGLHDAAAATVAASVFDDGGPLAQSGRSASEGADHTPVVVPVAVPARGRSLQRSDVPAGQ
jgi:integrase